MIIVVIIQFNVRDFLEIIVDFIEGIEFYQEKY